MSETLAGILTKAKQGGLTIPPTLLVAAWLIGSQINTIYADVMQQMHSMHVEAVAAIKSNESAVIRLIDEQRETRRAIELRKIAAKDER